MRSILPQPRICRTHERYIRKCFLKQRCSVYHSHDTFKRMLAGNFLARHMIIEWSCNIRIKMRTAHAYIDQFYSVLLQFPDQLKRFSEIGLPFLINAKTYLVKI